MQQVRRLLVLLSFLLGLFVALPSGAQNQDRIIRLRSDLRRADSLEVYDIWCKLAFEYRNSFPDSTFRYAQAAFALGNRLGLKSGLATPLSFTGLSYNVRGDRTNALKYYLMAFKVALSQEDSLAIGFAHNNLGRLFLDVGDLARAEQNFRNAVELFHKIGDQSGLAYAWRSLSETEVRRGEYAKALDLLDRAFTIRKSLDDKRTVISTLLEMSAIHQLLGEKEKAWKHLEDALKTAQTLSDEETVAEVQIAMAESRFRISDFSAARVLILPVQKIISKIQNEALKTQAFLLSAKINLKSDSLTGGLEFLKRALRLAENSSNLAVQKECLVLWMGANERLRETRENPSLKLKLVDVEEKIQRGEGIRDTERLYLQLQVEQSELDNQELKLKLAEEEVELTTQRLRNVYIGALAILFIAGSALMYFFLVRQRKTNELLRVQNQQILKNEEEIQAANARLEARNEELLQLSAEKDSLISIVAHDLRTPLNQVFGLMNLIAMSGELNDKQRSYLGKIDQVLKNGAGLIQDLLDTNNYRSGEIPAPAPINIPEFAAGIKGYFEQAAATKGISLDVSAGGEASFMGEPGILKRICDNLISNALKFSPSDGRVAVRFQCDPDALRLSVADSGPGFTQEDRAYLFMQFRKLSARPTGGEPSNGLGLAIVKSLADRFGGEIRLESEPGKGARFEVTLPHMSS